MAGYLHTRRVVQLGTLALSLLMVGCFGKDETLYPVEGKVFVDEKALHVGSLVFIPDATKDNHSTKHPAADIQSDGSYKVMTAGKPGAAPGWYKVSVVSQEPVDPKDYYKPLKSFANAKFIDPEKSGLRVQVVETPAAGAYDLKLTK